MLKILTIDQLNVNNELERRKHSYNKWLKECVHNTYGEPDAYRWFKYLIGFAR